MFSFTDEYQAHEDWTPVSESNAHDSAELAEVRKHEQFAEALVSEDSDSEVW